MGKIFYRKGCILVQLFVNQNFVFIVFLREQSYFEYIVNVNLQINYVYNKLGLIDCKLFDFGYLVSEEKMIFILLVYFLNIFSNVLGFYIVLSVNIIY